MPFSYTARDIAVCGFTGELGLVDRPLVQPRFFPLDKTGRATQNRLRKLSEEARYLKSMRIAWYAGQRGRVR